VYVPSHLPLYPMRTVVRLTNVEAHRIRFWESRYGLVRPARDESGRRLYSRDDVDLIRRIGMMVDKHGLSLKAIRGLLSKQTD
jgi:DNA-binding transcriptional MerR regulator